MSDASRNTTLSDEREQVAREFERLLKDATRQKWLPGMPIHLGLFALAQGEIILSALRAKKAGWNKST